MKQTGIMGTIKTKECFDCGWQGIEDDLVSSSGLKDDVEYIHCPSCWGEVIDMEEIMRLRIEAEKFWNKYPENLLYTDYSITVQNAWILMSEFAEKQINKLKEENKKLKFMIENGLGWEDMKNDITYPHEL